MAKRRARQPTAAMLPLPRARNITDIPVASRTISTVLLTLAACATPPWKSAWMPCVVFEKPTKVKPPPILTPRNPIATVYQPDSVNDSAYVPTPTELTTLVLRRVALSRPPFPRPHTPTIDGSDRERASVCLGNDRAKKNTSQMHDLRHSLKANSILTVHLIRYDFFLFLFFFFLICSSCSRRFIEITLFFSDDDM